MKVKVLGNGTTWFVRQNTHFLIDDKIILDTPGDSVKEMYKKIDFSKIKYIFITHFHQDHFIDLNVLFDIFRQRKMQVTVYAPKTAFERLRTIMKATDNAFCSKKNIKSVFKFVVVKPGDEFEVENYKVKAFKAEHQVKYALSYVFSNDKISVGFSGDTSMCNDLLKFIEASNVIFIETTYLQVTNCHLSVGEIENFIKKYPNKKFYSVHVIDEIYKKYKKVLDIPKINDEIII